jgi:medium-chain acyl-[acyl-carrier-protein] hydrolase
MNSRERFEETFSVFSYELDLSGKLSIHSLFNRFQEIAGLHAACLQVGYNELRELNLAWVLSRIKLRIYSLPQWGDTVRLATWPKGIDRLFALREFCLADEKNKTMVAATSSWLLIETEKGRPRRIETLPVDLHFPGAEHAIAEPVDKIQMPEGLIKVFEKPVWISDLDANRHVNNAQYAKWITDCLPYDQSQNCRVTSVQINYLEEMLLGDTVSIFISPRNDMIKEYFLEGVSAKKGSKVFQARITWE